MVLLSQTDKHAWDHFYKNKLCRLLRVSMQVTKGIHADTKFKASNGWLDSLIIKQMTGECADVQEETVNGWYR